MYRLYLLHKMCLVYKKRDTDEGRRSDFMMSVCCLVRVYNEMFSEKPFVMSGSKFASLHQRIIMSVVCLPLLSWKRHVQRLKIFPLYIFNDFHHSIQQQIQVNRCDVMQSPRILRGQSYVFSYRMQRKIYYDSTAADFTVLSRKQSQLRFISVVAVVYMPVRTANNASNRFKSPKSEHCVDAKTCKSV